MPLWNSQRGHSSRGAWTNRCVLPFCLVSSPTCLTSIVFTRIYSLDSSE